ncbi:hypothetical protein [Roseiflexus castenholzii]|jgi:hypothetical protein|uniref:Uncharacterized protein n=1 Tax=Roseiflexus castenholzii (strain DSM 13941 / HLO8) TaxID=383372 RepID=A7NLE5_ROSCS|nr:hypothetical protein [Roseiflexus castenholzii]ABU58328.1 hypothetical protein Rcas_2245 [Roseiflexus castenholzii DSM 13941]
MPRTIEVIVHADGLIEPLEPIVVSGKQRGLLTILETPSEATQSITLAALFTRLQSEGLLASPKPGAARTPLIDGATLDALLLAAGLQETPEEIPESMRYGGAFLMAHRFRRS